MKPGDFADLVFARDLLSANHADGKDVHFTHQERVLLLRLINSPGRLLRREVLLDAINTDGTEPAGDRHVDFLINRLRRKLRDDARQPRFIRTQYGEGYVWVGDVPKADDEPPDLLRLGHVYGGQLRGGSALIEGLMAAIRARLEPGSIAIRSEQSRPTTTFTLDASLHDAGKRLQAALVLRNASTSAMVDTFRVITGTGDDAAAIAATAEAVALSIWSSEALPTVAANMPPGEPPPWVRLFEAALMMDGDMLTWKSNAERLDAILADEPDNAVMELMRGLNLYTWLLQSIHDPSGQIVGEAQWRAVEEEIEAIALAALPRFDDQPIMQLAAAKLLLFVDRGYLHLVCRIAEEMLEGTSAHAAAFTLAGEAVGFTGDIARGTALLERALELSVGTQFRLYLLVIEATAILAGDNAADFERICRLTRAVSPGAYQTLQAFCALPGYEQEPQFIYVIARDAGRAKEALRYLWNISARRFVLRAHRRNVMRPLTAVLVARYGLDVIPDEVDLGTGLRAELSRMASVRS